MTLGAGGWWYTPGEAGWCIYPGGVYTQHIPGWCIAQHIPGWWSLLRTYPGGGPSYAHTRVGVHNQHIPGLVSITSIYPGVGGCHLPGCGRGVTYPGWWEGIYTTVLHLLGEYGLFHRGFNGVLASLIPGKQCKTVVIPARERKKRGLKGGSGP